MENNSAHYKVFVVRCWNEQNSPTQTSFCRFTLEIPRTGQRFGYTSSEALMAALEHWLVQDASEENA